MINLFQPTAGDAELAAIRGAFASNWLGTGPRTAEFETAFATYVGCPAGEFVAITSCTEGLFQAMAALDLGPGDEVVLPTISFIGAAHAVHSTGARIVLCDVDPLTLNPTVEHIADAITPATKAVMLLHYGGGPGSIAEIAALTTRLGVVLVEDAACSLGAFTDEVACGTFGDIGIWSFDSMKVMTTGDGGMLWCRDPAMADRIRCAVRLGGATTGFSQRSRSSRWWELEPERDGRRAAMNDLTAAMGLVQLGRLPEFLDRRREIAVAYDAALADLPWLVVPESQTRQTARIFYWVQVPAGVRDRLATHLLERDVYASFRYWPLHRTQMYRAAGPFPGADHAAEATLMLPLHQGLSDSEAAQVLAALRAFKP